MTGEVFPVTGHYMEYLFDEGKCSGRSGSVDLMQSSSEITKDDYDHKPVTHWGSHVGCITHAGIYGRDGSRKDSVRWNEEIEVRIVFAPPAVADRANLSAAFSIKNLNGTDLIVSTTYDRNPLVTGKYLLVAAIEDRSSAAIHYYEYLEGAHYFASVADRHLFGVFQPEIVQEVAAV
jgi:lipopolysaccharide transport system ATP-binding protein